MCKYLAVACLVCAVSICAASICWAADEAQYEVQHWSVWVADPTVQQVNATANYASAMPVLVQSPRVQKHAGDAKHPKPINVMSFYGKPVDNLEIDLRARTGSFVSTWPTAETSASRLRWLNQNLVEKLPQNAGLLPVPSEHWFAKARSGGALYVARESRSERFIAYDVQLTMAVPIKLEGGPDEYKVTNLTHRTLHDVAICVPTPAGIRVGWADAVQGGAPRAARLELSKPMQPGDELAELTTERLVTRLAAAGLRAEQAQLIASTYRDSIFAPKDLTAIARLDPVDLDEAVPVVFYPLPSKAVRVGLVIVRNIDPKINDELKRLIVELGSPQYNQRESAQQRLTELGALAYPAMRDALKHTDPEVVFRAETILLDQSQPITR